jgi:hypothetical protein
VPVERSQVYFCCPTPRPARTQLAVNLHRLEQSRPRTDEGGPVFDASELLLACHECHGNVRLGSLARGVLLLRAIVASRGLERERGTDRGGDNGRDRTGLL